MKIISICLARINSKRLSNKLLKQFCGKPMIHYTAEIMNQLPYESYIYTNSHELRTYILFNFAKINVEEKPEKYCQDKHITDIELKDYNQRLNADIFIYLAGTSPIRDIDIIKKGIDEFLNNLDKYDCAMGVKALKDRFYWYNLDMYGNNIGIKGCINCSDRNFSNKESFKLPIYEETGSIYIFKKELLNNNFFINEKCLFIEDNFCYDTDTQEDFDNAEKYYKKHILKKEFIEGYFIGDGT